MVWKLVQFPTVFCQSRKYQHFVIVVSHENVTVLTKIDKRFYYSQWSKLFVIVARQFRRKTKCWYKWNIIQLRKYVNKCFNINVWRTTIFGKFQLFIYYYLSILSGSSSGPPLSEFKQVRYWAGVHSPSEGCELAPWLACWWIPWSPGKKTSMTLQLLSIACKLKKKS